MNVNSAFWVSCNIAVCILRKSICRQAIFSQFVQYIQSLGLHSGQWYAHVFWNCFVTNVTNAPDFEKIIISSFWIFSTQEIILKGPYYPSLLSSISASPCTRLVTSISRFSGVLMTLKSKLMRVTQHELIFRNLWKKTKINLRTRRFQRPFTWYFDTFM